MVNAQGQNFKVDEETYIGPVILIEKSTEDAISKEKNQRSGRTDTQRQSDRTSRSASTRDSYTDRMKPASSTKEDYLEQRNEVTKDMSSNELSEYKQTMKERKRGVSDIVDSVQNITKKDLSRERSAERSNSQNTEEKRKADRQAYSREGITEVSDTVKAKMDSRDSQYR